MRHGVTAIFLVLAFGAGLPGQHRGGVSGGGPRGGGPVAPQPARVYPGPTYIPPLLPPRTYGSPSGFGNILFPGVGTAPPVGFVTDPSFGVRLGGTVSGRLPYTGGVRRGGIGYYVPVYVGGWVPQAEPAVTVVNPPQPAPPVVINQYFTPESPKPVLHDYTQAGLPEPPATRVYEAPATPPAPRVDQKPTIYLIAFKDGTIYTALSYWLEGDTLHYITTRGRHNRATLELVDVEMSERLNRERNLEFQIFK
jgi:hypothetical protein